MEIDVTPNILVGKLPLILTDESADALQVISKMMTALKEKYPYASVTLTLFPDLTGNIEATEYHGCGDYDLVYNYDFESVEALVSYALREWIKPANE